MMVDPEVIGYLQGALVQSINLVSNSPRQNNLARYFPLDDKLAVVAIDIAMLLQRRTAELH